MVCLSSASRHVHEEVGDLRRLSGRGRQAEAAPAEARQGRLRNRGGEGASYGGVDGGTPEAEHLRGGVTRGSRAGRNRCAAGRP